MTGNQNQPVVHVLMRLSATSYVFSNFLWNSCCNSRLPNWDFLDLSKNNKIYKMIEKKKHLQTSLRVFLRNKHALACTRKVNFLMTLMRRERDTTQHSTPDHIECNLFTLESTRTNYEQIVVYKLRLHLRSRRFNYFKIEASGTDFSNESFVCWCEKGSYSLQLSGAINSGDS